MTSPCRNCEHVSRNKNHPGCTNCPERIRFVNETAISLPEPVNFFVPKPKVKIMEPETTEPEKRVCAQCKTPKVILEFRRVKGGHHAKTCHVCMSDNLDAKRADALKVQSAKPKSEVVEIDFVKCPNLLAGLKKAAVEELRTFHDQVLWALVTYLKNRG